ncbi:MAG TPA: shikimate dehydrogenase [Rectinemataceae bacterium]|nr:shikimate dehydrogenase [Rectinemataceae bacterium]
MNVEDLAPAVRPTFYFIGVTTSKSSIMKVFPKWAEYLGLGDVKIRGIDCRVHDDPETYHRIVAFIKTDPLSLGALVTTHKMDLLAASRDLFEYLDPYAEVLGEISSISKRGNQLRGHAKDPITSGLSLDAFVKPGYWAETGAELCILGAGGSSLALSCFIMAQKPKGEWPSRVIVTNRSGGRLDHMKKVHAGINPGILVDYVLADTTAVNDAVVSGLKPGSLIVNATGLGKDAKGSPLSEAAIFPDHGLVWEYNYRGELVFLDLAKEQEKARSLTIEDGWIYFIHGWTRVIAEVFDVEIPTQGPAFDEICRIAAACR